MYLLIRLNKTLGAVGTAKKETPHNTNASNLLVK